MPYPTRKAATDPIAVNSQTAARLLDSTDASLERDRAKGHLGIPYVKVGRRVVYRLSDLEAWLSDKRIVPPEEYCPPSVKSPPLSRREAAREES